MTTGSKRDGFFVVHRHPAKSVANITGRCQRIGVAVRTLRIDVDQAHLYRAEVALKFAVTSVALIVQPFGFRAPIDILFGLPNVGTATGEAKGFETHGFQRDVAGQDHQVSP